MTLLPLGDSAVVLTIGDGDDPAASARGRALALELARHRPAAVVDVVPAFASVAIFFDAARVPNRDAFCAEIERLVARADAVLVTTPVETVEIPVCYGGDFGPDLPAVAAHTGLTAEQVVRRHAGTDYLVHAIGFAPGFPYLGGLPPELATPRRATPRASVPAGSVGIGGAQTGIYPLETPGGWNIIGRTPLRLFDAARTAPALLRTGDRVRFRAISLEEFQACRTGEEQIEPEPSGSANASPEKTAPLAGIEILQPGLFTTVQDLGRRGHRAEGVPLSGAADPFALRLANALVGNPEGAAGLEITLVGPEVRFHRDTVVALCGADFGGALPRWRPLKIAAGTRLRFGPARSGCRGYLAVAGGIDLAPVLGSRSTYTRAGLGGVRGRPLAAGDTLPIRPAPRAIRNHWRIDERILPHYSNHPIVRFVRGAQADEFAPGWVEAAFRVTSRSDRMGVRLSGPSLERTTGRELVSSPVVPGTLQVPPDGQPIVLLADAQTIGGYPQIGHVISADLPLVAQLRPGDTVRFQPVSLEQAHQLLVARERTLALLREGLAQKLRGGSEGMRE